MKNKFYYSDGTIDSKQDNSKILHREDGPAIEWSNGDKSWFINGKRHREDGPAIEGSNGSKYWYINGKLHREDGHAVEYSNGTKEWFINDKRHREDGPAIVYRSGTKEWFINGKHHREDGPARECSDGSFSYYLNGIYYSKKDFDKEIAKINKPKENKFYYSDGTISSKRDLSKILHRADGPAIEYSDGDKYWLINGKFHREDGPAVKNSDGYKAWYINGKRHRENGPAIEFSSGNVEYYLNGIYYLKEEFEIELIKRKSQNKIKKSINRIISRKFRNDIYSILPKNLNSIYIQNLLMFGVAKFLEKNDKLKDIAEELRVDSLANIGDHLLTFPKKQHKIDQIVVLENETISNITV